MTPICGHWIGIVHRNLGNWDSTFAAFDHARDSTREMQTCW